MILRIVVLVILLILLAPLVWGLLRTRKVEGDLRQTTFSSGTATLPTAGKYAGSSGDYKGSWQGKVLYEQGRGENMFNREGREELAYPFTYSVGRGVRDDIDVIVLDYNQPGNPWWLRFIRDEMVQTKENTYLGKVHVWIFPKTYLSLGYFELKK